MNRPPYHPSALWRGLQILPYGAASSQEQYVNVMGVKNTTLWVGMWKKYPMGRRSTRRKTLTYHCHWQILSHNVVSSTHGWLCQWACIIQIQLRMVGLQNCSAIIIVSLNVTCFWDHLGYPPFWWVVRVAHLFFWCSVLCLSSFCVLCAMLSVSLDCPFLISHSSFSNIYSLRYIWQNHQFVLTIVVKQ